MIDLDKLLELEAKATQGPWALEIDTAPFTIFLDNRFTELDRAEDLELISAMRNNIKDLCTELRAARDVSYFAQLLVDSVVRYEDGDVTIGSHYLDILKGSSEKLGAVMNEAMDES